MIKYILPILAIFFATNVFAQNTFKAIIKDSKKNEALAGVSAMVKATKNVAIADTAGQIVLQNIPNGQQTIILSHIGFQTVEITITFPLAGNAQSTTVFL